MSGDASDLPDALDQLTSIPHAVFAIMLHRLGGDITLDHEDGHHVRGKAVAYKCEGGQIRLWLVDVPKDPE